MSATRAATGVTTSRGHIRVECQEGEPLVFSDLGGVLDVWTAQGAMLGPEVARQLADALNAWAEREQVA